MGFVLDELARGNVRFEYFGFLLSVSFLQCSIIHSSVTGVTKTLLSCVTDVAQASWPGILLRPLTCRRGYSGRILKYFLKKEDVTCCGWINRNTKTSNYEDHILLTHGSAQVVS